jgi:UDPglucose--hexose-1-phosphate uridylyltransferase
VTARVPGQPGIPVAGRAPGAEEVDTWPGLAERPHRRYNPLLDAWVLVSAERTKRPWHGRHEARPPEDLPTFDPACYLCPGNTRANGEMNPDYAATWVFTNDFAALSPDSPDERVEAGLLRAEDEAGTCRVVCFSRRHDLTLARMDPADVRRVVDVWADQTAELGERFRWVQVFENRGEMMGASIPHPHGQIWAGEALPNDAAREDLTQRLHAQRHGRALLLDYAGQESGGPRVVVEDDDWLAVVPFWASWPYETLLIPKRPIERLPELRDPERSSLAGVLIRLLGAYDGLFGLSFPYSMGWHQAPFVGGGDEADGTDGSGGHWQLHAHFFPPLLRATVRKFMVGYELLAEPQRDLTAEQAADQLRAALEDRSGG